MDAIAKFTTDNWIAIAAILIPILLGLLGNIHLWLWSLIKKFLIERKIEVTAPTVFDLPDGNPEDGLIAVMMPFSAGFSPV